MTLEQAVAKCGDSLRLLTYTHTQNEIVSTECGMAVALSLFYPVPAQDIALMLVAETIRGEQQHVSRN